MDEIIAVCQLYGLSVEDLGTLCRERAARALPAAAGERLVDHLVLELWRELHRVAAAYPVNLESYLAARARASARRVRWRSGTITRFLDDPIAARTIMRCLPVEQSKHLKWRYLLHLPISTILGWCWIHRGEDECEQFCEESLRAAAMLLDPDPTG